MPGASQTAFIRQLEDTSNADKAKRESQTDNKSDSGEIAFTEER